MDGWKKCDSVPRAREGSKSAEAEKVIQSFLESGDDVWMNEIGEDVDSWRNVYIYVINKFKHPVKVKTSKGNMYLERVKR